MNASMLDRPGVSLPPETTDAVPATATILTGRRDSVSDNTGDTLGQRVGAGHVSPARAWQVPSHSLHAAPTTTRRKRRDLARNPHRGVKTIARRTFYRAWGKLPGWVQQLAVRLAARKVTLGACALIEDGRGRLLLARHTYRPRAWGLPGGFSRRGEEPAAGLARELREELGVAALIGPLAYAETESAGRHLTLYYRATLLGTPCVDDVELDALRFVALDTVPALMGQNVCALPWLDALRSRRVS